MDSGELLRRLETYGADVRGLTERFMNDMDLYQTCLQMFWDDLSYQHLGEALQAGNCKKAFEAAHTMKGVVANLGLTPLLATVTRLVEPLRAGSCAGLEADYEVLGSQLKQVRALLS